ncbi:hypothetical protein F511_16602 [Dorcoceras hygrometricum]|uniref:Uncharacterized protein n=1 Tax=Dorcoceras hygrometricum TaxID=472368 RepID=A0A2Z7CAH1_9LAMI|nr:hypothetical protein F511_16602 [Dorcoceras hygrometricum]
MAARPIAVWSCPSSSTSSSSSYCHKARTTPSTWLMVCNGVGHIRRNLSCLAVQQESSTSTVPAAASETKEIKEVKKPATDTTDGKAVAEKPKAAAKAPAKSLPALMEEDVIPSLKQTLEGQQDITQLDLSFNDNKLEGSFLKKGNAYSFWAFFPDGTISGPKGFSISSYGNAVSTVEPFLVDEKKPTANHVVFWVEKRLAAQGIIPVWKD